MIRAGVPSRLCAPLLRRATRTRPAYSETRLHYDTLNEIEVGDYLRTPAGSAYCITHMRTNKNRSYRKHLVCLRWPLDAIPADAVVHELHWYPRRKKQAVHIRPGVPG